MATVTTLVPIAADNTHISENGNVKQPYLVEKELNFATALTAKGSALAAADIIQLIRIPPGTVVLGAGIQNMVVADATTLTLGVGTTADDNEWVDAFNAKSAAGTYGTDLDAVPAWNTYTTTATIDVTFQTLTGTLTTGRVRVYALLMDVSDAKGNTAGSGIAVIGS